MAADIRLTSHSRRWRLRRHLGQAALGVPVGLSASTSAADTHGDVDRPTSRLCGLAQALRVTWTDRVTWTEVPRATRRPAEGGAQIHASGLHRHRDEATPGRYSPMTARVDARFIATGSSTGGHEES